MKEKRGKRKEEEERRGHSPTRTIIIYNII
jgi:hypothetical protein